MILALNTGTPTCELFLYDGTDWHEYSWEAGRTLASHLLEHIVDALAAHDATIHDIAGVVVYKGPGSFTGLRIGITVANTLATADTCRIVGESGEDWRNTGLERLNAGQDDAVVMPVYGAEPHITQPRK